MVETMILLCGAAALTLPSLISHKKEAGREILRKIVFVQGGLGFALFAVAAVVSGLALAGAGAVLKDPGVLVWASRFIGDIAALGAGAVLALTLLVRLGSLRAPADTRERADRIFFSLIEFQTAVGFLCLVLAVWLLVCELFVNPLIRG